MISASSSSPVSKLLLLLTRRRRSLSPYSTLPPFSSKTLIHHISNAFLQNNPKLLNPHFLSKLQPHHLHPILLSLQSNPVSALRFFDWSHGSLGLHHSPQSFCDLIHLLLRNRMLAPASRLFDTMVGQFGSQFDYFAAFSDCFRNHSSDVSLVSSFLIENFCRNGMLDSSVDTFIRTYKLGVRVSPYALSRMLNCLVDANRVDMILDAYGEICSALRGQHFCAYEFIMVGLLNKGRFETGLEFHSALIDRGFSLDIVACNKILKRLCKENQVGDGEDFFTVLLTVGPKPNVVTFSTMINGYCKDGKLEEAKKLYKIMIEKGRKIRGRVLAFLSGVGWWD
nr:putative pentatricopeptide repeat-containing protein At1g31840 [Malus domestica]